MHLPTKYEYICQQSTDSFARNDKRGVPQSCTIGLGHSYMIGVGHTCMGGLGHASLTEQGTCVLEMAVYYKLQQRVTMHMLNQNAW